MVPDYGQYVDLKGADKAAVHGSLLCPSIQPWGAWPHDPSIKGEKQLRLSGNRLGPKLGYHGKNLRLCLS